MYNFDCKGRRSHPLPTAWWRAIGDTDLRLISNIRLCFSDESTKKAGTNRHDFSVVCAKTASRPTISTTVFRRSTKTIGQWREHGESEAKLPETIPFVADDEGTFKGEAFISKNILRCATCIEEHGLCVEVLESLMFEFDSDYRGGVGGAEGTEIKKAEKEIC